MSSDLVLHRRPVATLRMFARVVTDFVAALDRRFYAGACCVAAACCWAGQTTSVFVAW